MVGHLGGACASSKQAASKQQQLDPQGPGRVPQQQGSRHEKQGSHAIRDGFPQCCWERLFFCSDLHQPEKAMEWVFRPIWGLWHSEQLRTRVENRKIQFPGVRGTFGGEIRPPKKVLPRIPHFLHFHVLADLWPPRAEHRKILFLWAILA